MRAGRSGFDASSRGLPASCLLSPPIATIQRTSGEVRFVLFRKWDRHYSIASAARTELPRVRRFVPFILKAETAYRESALQTTDELPPSTLRAVPVT